MKKKEFLKKLTNYERWSQLNSPIFQALIEEFFNKTKNINHQKVAINKKVAQGDFNKNIFESDIARIYVVDGTSTYMITIVEKEDDIEVMLTIEHEFNRMTFTYRTNIRRLSTLKEVWGEDGFHEDFHETIIYYDESFKPRDLDVEEELDASFSYFFNIPLQAARIIRKDFKKYRGLLIDMTIAIEMKENDDEDEFTSTPLTLENLPLFIECQTTKKDDICPRFDDCSECFYYEVCTEKDLKDSDKLDKFSDEDSETKYDDEELAHFEERAENIKKLLSQSIPTEIPLVFGIGLYVNIETYVLGESKGFLETTGKIIGKIDNELFVYQVHLTGDTAVVYKREQPMSQEEISKLEEQGIIDTDELKEFFKTGRSI